MKRVCILWIVMALVIAGFSVSLAEGNNGNQQMPPSEARRQQQRIEAEDILLNQETTILIPVSESVWLRFVPAKTDGYCFYSSCSGEDMDPVAYLYDGNLELITASDDDDEDVNFRLSCVLESGETYYFCCECTAEEDGECPVMLTNASGLLDAEAMDLPDDPAHYLTLSVKSFATEGTALSYQWYRDLPDDTDEGEIIEDSSYQLLEGENREFLIVVRPDEQTGYCCRISDDQGNERTVFFSLDGKEDEDEPEDEDPEDDETDETEDEEDPA